MSIYNYFNIYQPMVVLALVIRFDMIYDCHFEMTAQKFSYRESFSSARAPKILVTKMTPNSIFSYTDFFAATVP